MFMKVSGVNASHVGTAEGSGHPEEARGKRDPEMHQTKKGKDWHFGMKAHVGVDSKTKLIHSVAATPANVADGNMVGELLHGSETHVWGDGAYSGRTERISKRAQSSLLAPSNHCLAPSLAFAVLYFRPFPSSLLKNASDASNHQNQATTCRPTMQHAGLCSRSLRRDLIA
jgi:Transposase DDE domain